MSLRGEAPQCVACARALELVGPRWSCEQCGSVMIPSANVATMMNEMSPDDLRAIDARLVDAQGTQRRCPHCAQMMSIHALHGVTIDRCPEHGIWFDSGELMIALEANAMAYAERNPSYAANRTFLGMIHDILGPWLARRRLRKDRERGAGEL